MTGTSVSFFASADTLPQLRPGRHSVPRDEVEYAQRQRLLTAAVELFGTRGLAQTTVAHIIRGAGVSRKTFYEQFGDREDCFAVAFDIIADTLTDAIARATHGATSWTRTVIAAVDVITDTTLEHPAAIRACLVDGRFVEASARRLDELIDQAVRFLDRGRTEGPGSTPVPEVSAIAAVGALRQVLLTGRPDLRQEARYVMLAPFLGAAAARRPSGLAAH